MNIHQLLDIAVARKASDLHLVVGYPPSLRLNGELLPITGTTPLLDADILGLVTPLLSVVQKKAFDENFELDFGFSFEDKARFRINLFKEQGHLAAALRLIPLQIPEMSTLGLPEVANKLIVPRQGFILITGPTGHGKSTTLASMINQINLKHNANILTIEDPIEYIYPKGKSIVTQRELLLDTKTWPNALRSALREDPDVVLVGEMRDYETIAAAITIAETGHLVFATLHTNSAAQSIDRMIDVFPQNQQPQIRLQLAAVLEAIISQRLIPTIVPGRALAVELLLKTNALSSLIRDAKTHMIDNLIQTSGELGMVSMEASLAKLVREGKISLEMGQAYSLRPDLLAKILG
ncbi:MAG: PilT/PilU family type 4a pilus ATPase [Candidatus Daviesbacteria bacterium]|nr:PilT/PilU family type 4a pilus ATPase [Candidatus Daviesbacteria bacterium]